MDILVRIKQLVLAGRVYFTRKADMELERDGLVPRHVYEAIVNAPAISKVLRSRRNRTRGREKLYVIKGLTYDGILLYTKGKIARFDIGEVFYVLLSSKRSTGN